MRVFASLIRKKVFWAGVVVAVLAIAYWYPSIDTKFRLYSAKQALIARDADHALEWLRTIPEHRSSGEREFLLARAYRRLAQQDLAREHLQTAFDLGIPVERLQREQWLAMAQSGQMRESEPHLRRLLQDPGDDGQEICEAYVKGYIRNRQFSKAQPILNAWQADFPNDPQPHVLRGSTFQEAENWSGAISEYREALKRNPGDTDVRVQLAVCLKITLKYDEAEIEFRKCLQSAPNDKILLAEWGEMLLSNASVQDAAAVFQQLLAIDAKHPEARLQMAGIHLMNGKLDDALKIAQPLFAERPYDKRVMYSLASIFQAAGRAHEADELYARVAESQEKMQRKQQLLEELQKDSTLVNERFEIAMIVMNYQSPEDGLRWLFSVIDLDPGYTEAYLAIADYYKSIGNAELEQKFREQAQSSRNKQSTP